MKAKLRLKWKPGVYRGWRAFLIVDGKRVGFCSVSLGEMASGPRIAWDVDVFETVECGTAATAPAAQLAAEACLRKTLKAAVRRMG